MGALGISLNLEQRMSRLLKWEFLGCCCGVVFAPQLLLGLLESHPAIGESRSSHSVVMKAPKNGSPEGDIGQGKQDQPSLFVVVVVGVER